MGKVPLEQMRNAFNVGCEVKPQILLKLGTQGPSRFSGHKERAYSRPQTLSAALKSPLQEKHRPANHQRRPKQIIGKRPEAMVMRFTNFRKRNPAVVGNAKKLEHFEIRPPR